MIHTDLHQQPQALDRVKHRDIRLRPIGNLGIAAKLNSLFIATTEFVEACKEFPILFLDAGNGDDGKPQVAPVAVLGLTKGENLLWDADKRQWDARYVPALLRAYPFTTAPMPGNQFAICIDRGWEGFVTEGEGQLLFTDAGEPTEFLQGVRKHMEALEAEVTRTRAAGVRLMEMKLLAPKRFDATLPDGSTLSIDGFLTVDEARWAALTDAEIVELHKNGLAALLQMHRVSLGNMTRLVERRLARQPGQPGAKAAAPAVAANDA